MQTIKTYTLCSANLENPYDEVIREHCAKFDCPRAKAYQSIHLCAHKALEWNILERKKRDCWKKKEKQIFLLLKNAHLIAMQEIDYSFLEVIQKKSQTLVVHPDTFSVKPFNVLLCDTQAWTIIDKRSCDKSPILDIKDKVSKKIIRIASVHLKGYNIEENGDSREGDEELETLVEVMFQDQKGISGYVIMGDFNAPPDSKRCQMLREKYQFKQLAIDQSRPTDHTHTNIYSGKKQILDMIFFKDLDVQEKNRVLPEEVKFVGKDRVSDHMPVYGKLIL